MSIIHIVTRENPYAQIDKRVLGDNRLSWRAKGILAYLLSKPSGWKVNVKDIWNNGAEGRNAVQDCLVELQKIGYAELKTVTGEHGKLMGSQWIITEEPKGGFSELTDKPKTGKPTNRKSGSRVYSNNEEDSNNELSEMENEHTPTPAESETLKAEEVKRGMYAPPAEAAAPTHTVTTIDPADQHTRVISPFTMPRRVETVDEAEEIIMEWAKGDGRESVRKWYADAARQCTAVDVTAMVAKFAGVYLTIGDEGKRQRMAQDPLQFFKYTFKSFLKTEKSFSAKVIPGASAQQNRPAPSALPLSLQNKIGK